MSEPAVHAAEHILNQTMVRMFGCPRSRNAHGRFAASDKPATAITMLHVEEIREYLAR